METNTTTLAPLPQLAEQINHHHRACEAAMNRGLDHALQAGRLLIEAKAQVNHGGWLPWLKENFVGSDRTAQIYMRVADRWPEIEAKAQEPTLLTLDAASRLLTTPKAGPGPIGAAKYTMPAGFTLETGKCLGGKRLRTDGRITHSVWVAESIEHPGYWNIILIGWLPQSAEEGGFIGGMQRPVHSASAAMALHACLERENLLPDQLEWEAYSGECIKDLREQCDSEAHLLWNGANYHWLSEVA